MKIDNEVLDRADALCENIANQTNGQAFSHFEQILALATLAIVVPELTKEIRELRLRLHRHVDHFHGSVDV